MTPHPRSTGSFCMGLAVKVSVSQGIACRMCPAMSLTMLS